MDSCHDLFSQVGIEPLATHLSNPEIFAEEHLSGGGAEANQNPRRDDVDLRLQPRRTCPHFSGIGFFVNLTLATRRPFEMFDDVRNVRFVAIDACFFESLVEHTSRRSDEGMACLVLFIARLLADEHNLGRSLALAKYG